MFLRILAVLSLTAAFAGCAVQIGDSCRGGQDCEGRVCDTTAPGGYCTTYQCTLNSCPQEAVCVDFELVQACMLRCEHDSDCRTEDGYSCRHDHGGIGYCYIPEPISLDVD